jgi:transposase
MRTRTLTDHQWEQLEPLLPPQRPSRGRPFRNHREIIDGILWRYRTGCPWRDLPAEFQPWITVYARLDRWQQDGTWKRVLQQLQRQAAAEGGVDWDLHLIDATTIRAHQHAAGGQKGGTTPSDAAGVASAPSSTSVRTKPAIPSPGR